MDEVDGHFGGRVGAEGGGGEGVSGGAAALEGVGGNHETDENDAWRGTSIAVLRRKAMEHTMGAAAVQHYR